MSVFNSVFIATGSRLVCLFYNDNTFEFKKLPVKDSSVLIKKGEDILAAYPLLNKCVMPFVGMTGIKRGRVLVACESDIIFDVFSRLADEEKPEKGPGLVKKWIQKKAETVRYRHQAKPKVSTILNKIIVFLGVGLLFMALGLFIAVLKGVY